MAGEVPDPCNPIRVRGGDELAVRREARMEDATGLAQERGAPAGDDVNEVHLSIVAADHQASAVWGAAERVERGAAIERDLVRGCLQREDAHAGIGAGGGEEPSIRRKGERLDGVIEPAQ